MSDSRAYAREELARHQVAPGDAGVWEDAAACRGVGNEIFFVDQFEPTEMARELCRRCAVQPECLEHALAVERHGIWGGLDELERRRIRSARARAASS